MSSSSAARSSAECGTCESVTRASLPLPGSRYLLCMRTPILFFSIIGCLMPLVHAQSAPGRQDTVSPPPFELYGLASGMHTVDASGTIVIRNPNPNQPLGFTPSGLASGGRAGFVWRRENLGLVVDFGFHKYSDRTGTTSMTPLMAGLRVYSNEHYRTSFFGEGFAGAYRWNVNSGNVNFTTVKGIVSGGGGMDLRLTRRLTWRVFEIRVAIAGARNGPLLTGDSSTGLVYRFGGR
jgi:hypothetical protein